MDGMDTATLPPMLSRPAAALVGLLSGAVALGVGHLVAGLVGPGASPYLAVGNTAIDLTPHPVKDFAVRTFGSYDKLVLLGGMAVVIALVAVFGGLVSRRRPMPGMVVIGALGVLGILAVLQRPDVGQLAPLAPAAAVVAGVLAFSWLHARAAAAEAAAVTRAPADRPDRPTHVAEPANTPTPTGEHTGGRGGAGSWRPPG
jgi:hypothetical protein